MSEIVRYTVCCHVASNPSHDGPHQYLVQGDDGPYVLWADHHVEVERLKAENARLTAERDQARADVERLTIELDDTREKLERVQVQYDEFAKVMARVVDNHQRERDHARQQVYLLQQAGADSPTDEDIWREAFMAAMERVGVFDHTKVADLALAEYRKRWPR